MKRHCVTEQDDPVATLEVGARFVVAPGAEEIAASASIPEALATVVTASLGAGEHRELPVGEALQPLLGLVVTADAFDGVGVRLGGSAQALLTGPLVLAGQITELLGVSSPGSIGLWNNAAEPRSITCVFVSPPRRI
jgi:hypothetical protein